MKKLVIRSEKHLVESIAIIKVYLPARLGKERHEFGKLGIRGRTTIRNPSQASTI